MLVTPFCRTSSRQPPGARTDDAVDEAEQFVVKSRGSKAQRMIAEPRLVKSVTDFFELFDRGHQTINRLFLKPQAGRAEIGPCNNCLRRTASAKCNNGSAASLRFDGNDAEVFLAREQ